MKNKPGYLLLALLLISGLFYPRIGSANKQHLLTLKEAVELALAANPDLSLFLQEQELIKYRQVIKTSPIVDVRATPGSIIDGNWQQPQGEVAIEFPITKALDLRGKLTLALAQNSLALEPAGTLNLNYDFLAPRDYGQFELSAKEKLRIEKNALLLQIAELLIQMRETFIQKDLAEKRSSLLDLKLQAAEYVETYDLTKLRQEQREHQHFKAELAIKIDQLQRKLITNLGLKPGIVYIPMLEVTPLVQDFVVTDYKTDFIAADIQVEEAAYRLEVAESQLAHEEKTRGWKLEAGGEISLDTSWNVGLGASKRLYPRKIIHEELALEVRKAEQNLSAATVNRLEQWQNFLLKFEAGRRQLSSFEEQLATAESNRDLERRRLEAGLITELQLQEAELELMVKQFDVASIQLALALEGLRFWAECGFDLVDLVGELIR